MIKALLIVFLLVLFGIGSTLVVRTWAAPLLQEGSTLPKTTPVIATPGTATPLTQAQKLRLAQEQFFQIQARSKVRPLFEALNNKNEALLSSPDRAYSSVWPVLRKLMLNMEEEQGAYHFYDEYTSAICEGFKCEFRVTLKYSSPTAVSNRTHVITVVGAPIGEDIRVRVIGFQ